MFPVWFKLGEIRSLDLSQTASEGRSLNLARNGTVVVDTIRGLLEGAGDAVTSPRDPQMTPR